MVPPLQPTLGDIPVFPEIATLYPRIRYMGSKYRLLPWIYDVLSRLEFDTALDAFSGSGCVSYLLKAMGKEVVSNDFLDFAHQIALATVENSCKTLSDTDCNDLLRTNRRRKRFIERTFEGVFFTASDLRFLDNLWANLREFEDKHARALVIASMVRACVKRQPRGVFTVAGDPEQYKDGRRDLRLTLAEHFIESVGDYNAVVWDNGRANTAINQDALELEIGDVDLVYMDPPYVPRSDDNCYIKRYHFLEGLASYWTREGTHILGDTKVKKIPKRFTPFSYRKSSLEAFERMFRLFANSVLVLSYSSNGYPDLQNLTTLMSRFKANVEVFQRDHTYHFGTHRKVSKDRATVHEYLIVGT